MQVGKSGRIAVLLTVTAAAMGGQQVPAAAEAKSKKTYPEDKGPKKIDVSKYPKEMQTYYRLFDKKCSRCHTLARPINSKRTTKKDWTTYVLERMRKKPNSGISSADRVQILKFLVYDSSVRKRKAQPKQAPGEGEKKQ